MGAGACREILYNEAEDGSVEVTGLRMMNAGVESKVTADTYIAALDVPGMSLSASFWSAWPFSSTMLAVLLKEGLVLSGFLPHDVVLLFAA